VPGAREAARVPETLHPLDCQEIGSVVFWPDGCEVTTASMEEYCDGAGPTVELAMQTGWVGPMEKLASRVPVGLVPVLVDDVPVPVPMVKWMTTTDPHSSPAATL